jgi:DNA-directed RNA polymerase specialized sigma24 family protein
MDAHEFFLAEWPAVSRRVGGMLNRRGLRPADIDDVVQETALRLYRSWGQLDAGRPVEPYAKTIALNVWRDGLRRGDQEQLVSDVPDAPTVSAGVEQIFLAREELSRTRRALGRMRPAQRGLLVAVAEEELGLGTEHGAVTDALRMARMRARRQLLVVLQSASAVAAAVGSGLRSLRRHQVATLAALPAAFALLAAVHISTRPAEVTPSGAGVQQQRAAAAVATTQATTLVAPRQARPAVTAGHRAQARRAQKVAPTYYWVSAGPAAVGAMVDVQVENVRVVVGDTGNGLPACVGGLDHLGDAACRR